MRSTSEARVRTVLPSWLASVEAEIQAKAGQIHASLTAIDRAEGSLTLGHEVQCGWITTTPRASKASGASHT